MHSEVKYMIRALTAHEYKFEIVSSYNYANRLFDYYKTHYNYVILLRFESSHSTEELRLMLIEKDYNFLFERYFLFQKHQFSIEREWYKKGGE